VSSPDIARWRRWFRRAAAPVQAGDRPNQQMPQAEPVASEDADEPVLAQARDLRASGDPQAALRLLESALADAARPALIHLEIGETCALLPDLPAAEAAFDVAVELEPALGDAWLRLGEIQARYERLDDALASLRQARECCGTQGGGLKAALLLANVLGRKLRFKEASDVYREVLQAHPDNAASLHGLAGMELRMGHENTAVELFERAFAIEPSLRYRSSIEVASAFRQSGRWHDALAMFEAEARRQPPTPTLRWSTCQTRLALGQWAAGWDDYASRFAAGVLPYRPLSFRTWGGEPMPEGTLLVLAEQGLGDEIMFASCLPDAQARVGHMIVECEPRLAPLLKRAFPQASVLPTRREKDGSWLAQAPREPDRQIFSGDLPRLFRRQRGDFPDHRGYLQADPARVAHWRERLRHDLGDDVLHVGISWLGGTDRTLQQRRTVLPHAWVPILQTRGCRFVNLQYGDSEAGRQELEAATGVPVTHYSEAIEDYDETAALVTALDLVVSVCTAIIHLSGALGRPVWILTPKVPEWRYTAHDSVLPWYPSTRLFRQNRPGEWGPICLEVAQSLRLLT
jgi:tetratricopeptide (TPR) repeat protein